MTQKAALITGASRGIGAATAKHLASLGYAVCINYKSNHAAAKYVLAEVQKCNVPAIAIAADITIESEVLRLFNELDRQFLPLTALVNNAGILLPQMPVLNMTAKRINKLFSHNVTPYFLCSREALKRMIPKAKANKNNVNRAIINVSSAAARTGSAGEYVDYAATKGAVDTLTIGLSLEVAKHNIRVNAVRPGFIDTDMHADGGEPNRIKRLAPNIPLQRGGTPHEVATAIAWLLSDEASYVTGSILDVAGGR